MARPDAGLLTLAVIWGVNFAVIKGALDALEPMAFNALRFPLAAMVLFVLMAGSGRLRVPERRHLVALAALGLLGNVAYQSFFIFGLAGTSAGNASLLLSTTPVWTALFSTVTRQERLPYQVWVGVCGTVLGIALLVGGGATVSFGNATLRGDLLMMGSSVLWAAYTVGSRPLVQRYGAMAVTGWTLWVGTPFLVLLGIPDLRHVDLRALDAGVWGAVVYAGVLAISIAYLLWNRGIRRLGNARTAVYANLVPVVALVAAWVALGEQPTPLQLSGAAVILGSLTLTNLSRGRAHVDAAPRETRTEESPRG